MAPVTDLGNWTPRQRPDGSPIEGRYVRLERLDPARHGDELSQALSAPGTEQLYDYLFEAPGSQAEVRAWIEKAAKLEDPFYYAVIDRQTGRAVGRMALMRIDVVHGVIEIGSILYAPQLQRTRGATECITLLASYVFDQLGYRRFEWKCNDRNEPSKRAAFRFGYQFEGVFRNHMVAKGRNRDTAWFSMTDAEWAGFIKPAHELWLDPGNFDASGQQKAPLSAFLARFHEHEDIELIRARAGDLDDVVAIQQAAYAPNRAILGVEPVPLLWDYEDILRTHEVWVDRWPGPFSGMLVLKPRAEDFEISSIAIAPEAQGTGLGNLLLEAAEARARALGKTIVRLYTGEALTRNIEWYQRRGYAIERVEQLPDRRIVHFIKTL